MTKLYPFEAEPVCPKCGAPYSVDFKTDDGRALVCVHSKHWLPEDKKAPECLKWQCRECRGIWWMELYEHDR